MNTRSSTPLRTGGTRVHTARLLATAALAFTLLAATPGDALATGEPPPAGLVTVRAVLHQRAVEQNPHAWWIDIGVRGTEVPIRIVRRVVGSCAVRTRDNPEGVFARVACATRRGPVAFEVARDGEAVVVRRTVRPGETEGDDEGGAPTDVARGGGPAAADAPLRVIARAALPANATVQVARR